MRCIRLSMISADFVWLQSHCFLMFSMRTLNSMRVQIVRVLRVHGRHVLNGRRSFSLRSEFVPLLDNRLV